MDKFWMVWDEENRLPRYKHTTENAARVEAERLATQNQGRTFHVLGLVDSCKVKTVFWKSEQDHDEIPF